MIVDAIRSPLGRGRAPKGDRPGGALSAVHPVELLAQVIRQLVERSDLDPTLIEDVITGCVNQVGEQSGQVGRMATLAAGLPDTIPAVSIHRACGSSQQAADFAAQGVIAGVYDVVIAAGVESMSRVPMWSALMDMDIYSPAVTRRYEPGLVPQGISAELIAARHGMDRTMLDEYSARSHDLASTTDARAEIVPITLPDGRVVIDDETPRPGTTVESLAGLPTVFRTDEMEQRFPEIDWHITAGNSSQLADGAAAVLIMSEERALQLGLTPRARFSAFALAGDDPITMLTGPIPATEKVLRRSGVRLDDIDHYEVNEAFASVPLLWREHFGADPAKLNPRGGAIALGHPLGASGARLLTTLVNGLEHTGGRYGLQTICEAGGMANATLIERC
ncbi:thiolase family protein [Aeromicrobium fastidiosum]|uniref:thiolase family protein n=1 Tax=Aeromicrobium fastidiosum TaxID=52699 RepID=UPI001FEB6BAB|nr:thiolase family protein [Aeromicrobium fastidiosum]